MPDRYGIRDTRAGVWVEGCAPPGRSHRLSGTEAEMTASLSQMRKHCPGTCRDWRVERLPTNTQESRSP